MQTKDLKQLKEIGKSETYKHFSLVNSKGEIILGFNALNNLAADHMEKIIMRLKSDGLPNGQYTILAKHTQSRKTKPDEYFYQKGEPDLSEAAPGLQPQGFSQDMAVLLEYKIENKFLKEKIEFLNKELEEMGGEIAKQKAEIEALEIELNEASPESESLGQPAPTNPTAEIIKGLSEMALPVLNSFFDLKARQTEAQIEYLKNMRNAAQQGGQQGAPAEQQAHKPAAPSPPFAADGQQSAYNEADFLHTKFVEFAEKNPDRAAEIMHELFNNQNNTENES